MAGRYTHHRRIGRPRPRLHDVGKCSDAFDGQCPIIKKHRMNLVASERGYRITPET
jgi:hypothetical protein